MTHTATVKLNRKTFRVYTTTRGYKHVTRLYATGEEVQVKNPHVCMRVIRAITN